MAYSSYGSQINNKLSSLTDLIEDINNLDLAAIWQGKACDKQTDNLTTTKSALDTQVNQLNSLISVLSEIDKYDSVVSEIDSYNREKDLLDSSASNYSTELERLNSLISSSTTDRNNLKISINNALSNISNSYSQQYSRIAETEVISTVDIFNNANEYFSKIDSGFDMSATVIPYSNGIINDDNKYPNFEETDAWIGKNPYAYSNVGQCTWFAWGRFYEIYGYSPGFTTNGNGCVSQLLKAHGDKFYQSDTPVAGAVFSTGLNEQYGHVGIVIEVDEANDKIVIQDGNYNGTSDSFAVAQSDWGTRTLSLSEFKNSRGGTVFANPIGEEAVLNG